jgi:hypothetical protein
MADSKLNDVNDIALEVKSIIDSRVQWIAEQDCFWKEKYKELAESIKYGLEKAQENYDSMKSENLSIGTIEAEGYLRAMKDVVTYIEDDET